MSRNSFSICRFFRARANRGVAPATITEDTSEVIPTDYSKIYPELNGYIVRPILNDPPLCTLAELQDGTYSLYDLEKLHQIIELRNHILN